MAVRDWGREIWVAAGSGDRVGAARILPDAARSNVLSTETLQDLINDIWVMQDHPAGPLGYGALTDDEWVEVFTAAGQFVMPRKLPFEVTDPMRIFRAAPQERARGMSWCNSWRMGFVSRTDPTLAGRLGAPTCPGPRCWRPSTDRATVSSARRSDQPARSWWTRSDCRLTSRSAERVGTGSPREGRGHPGCRSA
jgi:hypothetical protein